MGNVSFKFVITIIAFVLIVVFAVQNYATATIKFLFWQFDVSMAIIIIGAAAIGALIGFLIFMLKYLRRGKNSKGEKTARSDKKTHSKQAAKKEVVGSQPAEFATKNAEATRSEAVILDSETTKPSGDAVPNTEADNSK